MHIRDRVKELRRVPASDLRPNPRNWRTHPERQRDALRGALAEVGYADALLARELEDGSLELVDGHLRAETTPDAVVPVLVLDVTREEADKILLTLDPLAGLAGVDDERLAELLASTEFASPHVTEMLAEVARNAAELEAELAETDRPEVTIPEAWQVVVECADEADQHAVFERLRGEGYKCRVLTL
jgi:ParB-like chromosome segregation protein Spo0J